MNSKTIKKILYIVAFLTPGTLFLLFAPPEMKSVSYLEGLIEAAGPFGPALFMAIYYILTLVFISATAFTVIAGVLFGKLYGTIYVVIAATLSAQTAFYIARYAGGNILDKLGEKGGIVKKLVSKLQNGIENNGFQTMFIMRCLFLPYMPASYAAGLVKEAKARDFFFSTLITNMIFSPAFVFLGDSLLKGPKALLLPVFMIILVLSVPRITKRLRKK